MKFRPSIYLSIYELLNMKISGERYVYKFVCDPEALFQMALAENHRNALKLEAAATSGCGMSSSYSSHHHHHHHHYRHSNLHQHPVQQGETEEGLHDLRGHTRCRHQYSDMLNQVYTNHLHAQLNSPQHHQDASIGDNLPGYQEGYQSTNVMDPMGSIPEGYPQTHGNQLNSSSRQDRKSNFQNYGCSPSEQEFTGFKDPLAVESPFVRVSAPQPSNEDTNEDPNEDTNNNSSVRNHETINNGEERKAENEEPTECFQGKGRPVKFQQGLFTIRPIGEQSSESNDISDSNQPFQAGLNTVFIKEEDLIGVFILSISIIDLF